MRAAVSYTHLDVYKRQAFNVPDLEAGIHACEDFGMKLTQWGKYNDASGAYAYLDARESLGCFIELLCSFPQ